MEQDENLKHDDQENIWFQRFKIASVDSLEKAFLLGLSFNLKTASQDAIFTLYSESERVAFDFKLPEVPSIGVMQDSGDAGIRRSESETDSVSGSSDV